MQLNHFDTFDPTDFIIFEETTKEKNADDFDEDEDGEEDW